MTRNLGALLLLPEAVGQTPRPFAEARFAASDFFRTSIRSRQNGLYEVGYRVGGVWTPFPDRSPRSRIAAGTLSAMLRELGIGIALAVGTGLAAAFGYVLLLWLPEADPDVIGWPGVTMLIVPPLAVSLLLRSRWSLRLVAAALGVGVALLTAMLLAVVLFVLGSR